MAALAACGRPPIHGEVASDADPRVVTSPNDDRAYDLITLSNGIEVILVSDPAAENPLRH